MRVGVEKTGSTHAVSPEPKLRPAKQTVGLLVQDSAFRRLLEGITRSLGLVPSIIEEAEFHTDHIFDFELILADESIARKLRPLIRTRQHQGEETEPAVVAIVLAPYETSSDEEDNEAFDAVLALPENPALLAAQLGVALYAHRAFAQRYHSALEELKLNRSIFKSVTSGISVANAQRPDLPLMYVNPAFEVMTGYTLEEVEGRNCRFLQKDDKDQPGLTLIREAVSQGRETVAILKNYRKNGELFWNELAISPIRNREGVLTHFVGIQMDVTERVEFETALRESEKLAAVGRLASAIAHEINNPLEAVMNLVYLSHQMLPALTELEEVRGYMMQADLELQRIKLITAQSLRFYKQSHGPEAITCEELFAPLLDIYAPRFRNYNVSVEMRDRSTQHMVCLTSEIRQVLSNLITNAVDAIDGEGGRLFLRTHEATDWRTEKRGVVLTVADTGRGMSSAIQANIYKPFYTTKGAKGTGLGLWISSEIVHRHHGRLRVRSSDNPRRQGTVFQVFLPFQALPGEVASA